MSFFLTVTHNLQLSHVRPSNPVPVQLQLKLPMVLEQTPPFKQGEEVHSSISGKIKRV